MKTAPTRGKTSKALVVFDDGGGDVGVVVLFVLVQAVARCAVGCAVAAVRDRSAAQRKVRRDERRRCVGRRRGERGAPTASEQARKHAALLLSERAQIRYYTEQRERVFIHPSSVVFDGVVSVAECPYVCFFEKVSSCLVSWAGGVFNCLFAACVAGANNETVYSRQVSTKQEQGCRLLMARLAVR
jgi:hypothetical protein